MKNSKKILTGLAAGAAAGLLTFLYVKPKMNNKSKEELANNSKMEETSTQKPNELFI